MDCAIDSNTHRILVVSRRAGESILIGSHFEVLVVALLPPMVRLEVVTRSSRGTPPECSLVSCEVNKRIRINDLIELVVRQVRNRDARLGVIAPAEIRILRSELSDDRC